MCYHDGRPQVPLAMHVRGTLHNTRFHRQKRRTFTAQGQMAARHLHASRDTRRNIYSAAHLYVGFVVVMMARGDLGRPSLWSSTRLGAVDERLIVSRIPVL